jgi:fructokinase
VLCIGEILWDSLASGLFLGGAPFNVAGHLRPLGVPAAVVSRVGRDRLGTEARARAARLGVATDLIQVDDALPTGFVSVTVDAEGSPSYEIEAPAAWDAIEVVPGLVERGAAARAVLFGSLAQRHPTTRGTIHALLEAARMRVFDVNLRPPFDDPDIVCESLGKADVVKLNELELELIGGWFDLPGGVRDCAMAIAERFGCGTVCVTRGARGAALLREGRWSEHPGYRIVVRDTVGAGDAFLAALLAGLLAREDDEGLLREANRRGAYVASREGAIPG